MSAHDPQMIKGVLRLLLLHVLAGDDGYGYAVVSRLRAAGFPELAEGTVYPALTRLEAAGLLTSYLQASSSGPARKYYAISDAGREELARARDAWDQLHAAVGRVLDGDRADQADQADQGHGTIRAGDRPAGLEGSTA